MTTVPSDDGVARLSAELERFERASNPQEWARLQVCLGDAFLQSAQGVHEWQLLEQRVGDPNAKLDESDLGDIRSQAWKAYWSALEECSPDKDLDLWARASAGLADAWVRTGLGPYGTVSVLSKAVHVLQNVLSRYPCKRDALLWGKAQHRLACARFATARRKDDSEEARRLVLGALESLEAAAEAFAAHGFPQHHQLMLIQISSMRQRLAKLDGFTQRRAKG